MTERFRRFALVLLPGAVLFCGCGRDARLTVVTEPPNAAVWVNGELRGPAPQEIRLAAPGGGGVRVRVSAPGHRDWEKLVKQSDIPPAGRLTVRLAPKPRYELRCTSIPVGAEVVIDGESRGRTPLTVAGLEADSCEVLFRADNREPVSRTVEFAGRTAPVVLDVVLPSLTEAYYLKQIETVPDDLANYVDLAHHYVLEKRFDKAAAILEKAVSLHLAKYRSPEEGKDSRVWSEVDRVITMQYDFGTEDDLRAARGEIRTMLERVLDKNPQGDPALYAEYVTVLYALRDVDKARSILDKALARFPDSKPLLRLRRAAEHRLFP